VSVIVRIKQAINIKI